MPIQNGAAARVGAKRMGGELVNMSTAAAWRRDEEATPKELRRAVAVETW